MFTYFVNIRIAAKTVNGKTYSDRYNQLVENVQSTDGYWDEGTSFFITQSDLSTHAFGSKVVKGLSAKDDLVLVFDPSDMSAYSFGPIEHLDVLASFFNTLKKAA